MTNELILSPQADVMMTPVGTVADFLHAYQLKKEIIEGILREGVDYGVVPGTDKPTLKKAGAEKMNNFYNLHPVFEDVKVTEDWTGTDHSGEPFFYYRQKCNLYKEIGNQTVMVASADGSCNSWEKKYRYRNGERVCPACGKSTIIKGKAEYGGGWLCFAKKGGCGAKFADNAPEITSQDVGQVKNPDVAELTNTILKMAQKRALVAATLIATNTSDYFTQDMEDFVTGEVIEQPHAQPTKPEDISQENGEPTSPRELIDPMGEWAVKYAMSKWNISQSDTCKAIASKKLGKRVEKADFIAIVDGVEA